MTGPHNLSDPYLAAHIRAIRDAHEELMGLNERMALTDAQREWARMADERCPCCGRLGFGFRCRDCDRG